MKCNWPRLWVFVGSELLTVGLMTMSCSLSEPRRQTPLSSGCAQTSAVPGLGLSSGDLAARTEDVITAGRRNKFLWILRKPHGLHTPQLAVERLDGAGSGHVSDVQPGQSIAGLPAGWQAAVAYPSYVMFDTAGCWRIRDLNGSSLDAVIVQVTAPQ